MKNKSSYSTVLMLKLHYIADYHLIDVSWGRNSPVLAPRMELCTEKFLSFQNTYWLVHWYVSKQFHCLHLPFKSFSCLISLGVLLFWDRSEPTGFLLKFNPSLNVVDKIHQNTPLHWAVAAGNVNAVDKLLEAGASLDIRNVKVWPGVYLP